MSPQENRPRATNAEPAKDTSAASLKSGSSVSRTTPRSPFPGASKERLVWVDGRPALPLRGSSAHWISGILERPDGYFVALDIATDEDFRQAAILACTRVRRCKIGTTKWWWYTSILDTQKRPRLHLVPVGEVL